jgi:LAGLIDADG endonuclease
VTPDDYWLSGFIQGDGSFQIKMLQRIKRGNLTKEVRLVLQIDQAERYLLDLIKNTFGGYVGYRQSQNTYYYNSTSFKNAVMLIHTLDVYQVYGGRRQAYKLWRKAYVIVQNGLHLTDTGWNAIQNLKTKLNAFEPDGSLRLAVALEKPSGNQS